MKRRVKRGISSGDTTAIALPWSNYFRHQVSRQQTFLLSMSLSRQPRKLIGRKMYRQDEAPNPWAERTHLDDMQKRSKLLGTTDVSYSNPRMSGDVKEVAATRTNIARLLESRNKDALE